MTKTLMIQCWIFRNSKYIHGDSSLVECSEAQCSALFFDFSKFFLFMDLALCSPIQYTSCFYSTWTFTVQKCCLLYHSISSFVQIIYYLPQSIYLPKLCIIELIYIHSLPLLTLNYKNVLYIYLPLFDINAKVISRESNE